MNDLTQAANLRRLLVGHYDELKRMLTRRLGSEDLAGEALQETYLRLERPARISDIKSPRQYLLSIATNIARMGFRQGKRFTDIAELDAAIGFVDEAPDPLSLLDARQEIEALQQAFDQLTPRRRRIIYAVRIEGVRLSDIAEELGVSQRLVEKELKAALLQCGASLNRVIVQRFGPRAPQASKERVVASATQEDNG